MDKKETISVLINRIKTGRNSIEIETEKKINKYRRYFLRIDKKQDHHYR